MPKTEPTADAKLLADKIERDGLCTICDYHDDDDPKGPSPERDLIVDALRRYVQSEAKEPLSAWPFHLLQQQPPKADPVAILRQLAETAVVMRWKEYEDRGEERIPCFISVETAKAIAEFISHGGTKP